MRTHDRPLSEVLGSDSPTIASSPTAVTNHRRELVIAGYGLVLAIAAGVIAHSGTVSTPERAVFHAINRLPAWLFPLMWPLEQLGNLVAGPLVAAIAAARRRWALALAALVVTFVDLEGVVKRVVVRERPGATVPDAIRRGGDVPLNGQSFPSGHAMLVTALAVIVMPYLRGRWRVVPWLLVTGVSVARVYVGAHNPLDVVAGCGLGLVAGAAVSALMSPFAAHRGARG
jgi:undecaprenyl-diphosphatase